MPQSASDGARRGIISAAGYLPHWRLQRSAVGAVLGGSQGTGTRTVASYDEDSLTLAVEAGRRAIARGGAPARDAVAALWFATTTPTYAEKTNATIAQAALRLDADVLAADAAGLRGANAALRAALRSTDPAVLVLAGDIRTGLAGSPEERTGGDAAAALLVGDDAAGPLAAVYLGGASASREFLDRWRAPGDLRTKAWEERFGQQRYDELAADAWAAALKDAGLELDGVTAAIICGPHGRAGAALSKKLGAASVDMVPTLADTVGFSGVAHAPLLLTDAIERYPAGSVVALISLADGADVFLFRVTGEGSTAAPTVATQLAGGNDSLPYAKYLAWRGVLPLQPPNRPEPARMSAAAAERRLDWKYGFVGSIDRESQALHLPPARVSFKGHNLDDMDPAPMADVEATVATFTVDSLAYSPSPPIVFAVADFDGGGRLPVELTDVTASEVTMGMKVEMTFRRLNTADGIANYFWKARPVRGVGSTDSGASGTGSVGEIDSGASGTGAVGSNGDK